LPDQDLEHEHVIERRAMDRALKRRLLVLAATCIILMPGSTRSASVADLGAHFRKASLGTPLADRLGCASALLYLPNSIGRRAEEIVRAVVSAAKAGDPTAIRLCIERPAPVRKGRPITFDSPDIETASDITKALGMIAKAMAAGELTPDEADTVATVIEAHRKAIETAELEERIRRLEAKSQ
jgi:hypothetical protein